ncbi:hypothetical protein DMB44_04445 [Thermoplasma sp. Kam2015]|uniref:Hint domain-containing protein n=1 Tax=Thermoplasma sp. Kam2015 TaxID=2094122 RepID=UPI000D82E2F4|nr:Hint domain-containing protein [Thermoplasma sp. Kam2015]PYB68300.1 hypothetical protein DMB44_04445 [Thermoplasma sp. Kam2015]
MVDKAKSVIIASIVVTSAFAISLTGMALEGVGPFKQAQSIGVQVFDGQGFPLVNASVQGIMYKPPDEGYGTENLFVVNTNEGGYASVTNLTPVRNLVNKWVEYQGAMLNSASHPDLLLLITYHDSNGTFLSIGSVNMSMAQISNGQSFRATIHMPLDKRHRLIPTGKPAAQAQASVVTDSSTLPTIIPDGAYFYWEQDYANYTPITQIPVTFAYIYGNAEAYISASASTTLNYNVGFALNPGSTSSAQYNAGGSGYSTSSGSVYSFQSGEMVYSYSTGSTGYAYINASVEGANYSLWYVDCYGAYPMDEYFYDVGIVNVQLVGSSSDIQSSTAFGITDSISNIEGLNTWQQETSGQPGQGIGNIGSQYYQISSQALVEQYTSTDSSWISFGIGLGAILLAFIAPPVGVALSVVGLLFGTLQFGSGFSSSNGMVQYDAPTNYDINTYVILSGSQYYLTNGYTGSVPMLGVEVYAYQVSSGSGGSGGGGGGGCVLKGTEITLANGTQIPVQDLRPGMKTLSYDTSNGSLIQSTVSSVTETNVSNVLELNNQIYISGMGDQPVYVKLANGTTEWLVLGEVNYGMSVFDPANNTWIPVTSITLHNGNYTVYDVVTARQFTDGGHTAVFNDYIANGVLLDKKLA